MRIKGAYFYGLQAGMPWIDETDNGMEEMPVAGFQMMK